MRHDYRTYLRAAGIKPIGKKQLRTEKVPGTVEIVVDRRGKASLYTHGEAA